MNGSMTIDLPYTQLEAFCWRNAVRESRRSLGPPRPGVRRGKATSIFWWTL